MPNRKMETISIDRIPEILSAGPPSRTHWIGWMEMEVPVVLVVRWSRGPDMEHADGCSRDHSNGQTHLGLSANPIRREDEEHISNRVGEYRFLSQGDKSIRPWLAWAAEVGRDSDGAALVEVVQPLGWIER